MYFSFLFFGHQSDKMKLELSSLLTDFFPTINFNIILVNNNKIGSFFNFKDSLPKMSRSCVVYKFDCAQCDAQYVGSTVRTLHTRMSEHLGVSPRTGLPYSNPSHSSIRLHTEQSCPSPGPNSFSIIDSDTNLINLRIKESIHINSLKPSLNEMNSAFPLHILSWMNQFCFLSIYCYLLSVFIQKCF